jgi:L-amino acid N-acyltransferase YncA
MTQLRPATIADADGIWEIFHAVVVPGDTFVFAPQTSREEALAYWFGAGTHAYVAEREGKVVGSYVLKPNQPGLGAHVANAAYMVSPAARGLGIGRLLGDHSLVEARRLGFRAMQFNAVVSTNEPAVKLWQRLGFRIVGTLPGAFRHAKLGFVDLFVMYRELEGEA